MSFIAGPWLFIEDWKRKHKQATTKGKLLFVVIFAVIVLLLAYLLKG